jgi:hypothetical protein
MFYVGEGVFVVMSHRTRSAWGVRAALAAAVAIFTLLMMVEGAAANGSITQPQQSSAPNAQRGCASRFSVSPTAGPIGTKITISGSRWPADQQVGIYFVDSARQLHPYNLGAPGVLKDGSWRLTIAIPSTVTFTPQGDEGTGAPVTQNVTTGNYLIYAATGDPSGFNIDQVCPAKFAVTNGPLAAGNGTSPASQGGSMVWVSIGLGLLALLLLAIVTIFAVRRWNRRKAGTITAAVALVLVVGGMLVAISAFSAHPASATSAISASGIVLYSDDFESDTIGSVPVGWTPEVGSSWSVQSDSTQVLKQNNSSTSTLYSIFAGDPTWTDYTFSASVKPGLNSTINGSSVVAIDGRHKDANNFYSLLVKNGNAWYLGKKVNGTFTTLATGSTSYNTTTWYTWTLTMTGNSISASINGTTLATVTDGTFTSGNISFTTRAESEIDSVVVTWAGTGPTPTPTNTVAPTSTNTPAPTATNTPVPTATNTPAPTDTPTPGPTPTDTPTPGATNTPTATATNTPTATATNTPTATATNTPTATATNTPTPGATNTPTPTPSGIGNISGMVTDPSGAALPGAQITTLPATSTTTTDSSGNYTLSNIPAGTYSVIATASGLNATYVGNIVVTNGNTTTANEAFASAVPGFTSMDTYFRPDQTGWNPASDGNTWIDDSSRYPGASVSIKSNQGFIDTFTAATDRDEWMGATYGDQMISADFDVLQFGQDAFQHGARLLADVTDTHHFIDFAINYATSTLQLWVNNNENWTMLKQVSVPKFITGQWYHSRLLVVGTLVYGKVWAYGTAEPNWSIQATQNSLHSGMGGTRSTFCDIYWANFTVQGLTTITGKVTNSSGGALTNASVTDGTNTVTTDSNGFYVLIEPNTSATYTVTASATGHNNASQNATTTNQTHVTLNFTLT